MYFDNLYTLGSFFISTIYPLSCHAPFDRLIDYLALIHATNSAAEFSGQMDKCKIDIATTHTAMKDLQKRVTDSMTGFTILLGLFPSVIGIKLMEKEPAAQLLTNFDKKLDEMQKVSRFRETIYIYLYEAMTYATLTLKLPLRLWVCSTGIHLHGVSGFRSRVRNWQRLHYICNPIRL